MITPYCEICKKMLNSKRYFKQHMKTKHNIEIIHKKLPEIIQDHHCDLCGRVYPTRSKLKFHIRWHRDLLEGANRPHGPCSVCAGFFKTRNQLVKHEKTHIPKSLRNFWYCDLCGHRFRCRGLLFSHIKMRHIEKVRFYCKDCPGTSFSNKYRLKEHVDFKHLNIRKHVCEQCGRAFPTSSKLKIHHRVHTGEQPFQCQYCDRRFTHQADHMRHEWAHTGTRKYCCKLCRVSYNSIEEREAHKCPWKY
jgi:KRAB domain-containing zinc finger protein